DISLDGVLRERLQRLPAGARRVLEVIAVAGRPIEQALAAQAAGVPEGGDRQAIALLRAGHLVRTRGARGPDEIETFHDRIRESAIALLDAAALADTHRR